MENEIERLRAALTKILYLEAPNADAWIACAQEEAREALAEPKHLVLEAETYNANDR